MAPPWVRDHLRGGYAGWPALRPRPAGRHSGERGGGGARKRTALADRNTELFLALEWGFTLLFNAEYIARLVCVERPLRYATSFFGLVDLASVLPMYLALLSPGAHVLIDVRIVRMLRAFRILKLTEYVREYASLSQALYASRRKIAVFLSVVALVVVVLGTLMYVIEGPDHGFTSIPVAIYWAITTMTTVGFGDIAPKTSLGRVVASVVMLLGWGILAVPTGIVTAEMTTRRLSEADRVRQCPSCRSVDSRSRGAVLPALWCGARLARPNRAGTFSIGRLRLTVESERCRTVPDPGDTSPFASLARAAHDPPVVLA